MARSLYLLGAPGVGKSTLMARLLEPYLALPTERLYRTLKGSWLHRRDTGTVAGVYLGVLRPAFPGTDGLSMAVHPHAVTWVEAAAAEVPLLLGEGARLGTGRFLAALASQADTNVLLLTAGPSALAARRAERGSQQASGWARGAETRAARAADAAEQAGARVLRLDTTRLGPDEVLSVARGAVRP